MTEHNLLTINEAADFLRVSRATIYQLIRPPAERNRSKAEPLLLPHVKIGTRVRFVREDLVAYAEASRGSKPEGARWLRSA